MLLLLSVFTHVYTSCAELSGSSFSAWRQMEVMRMRNLLLRTVDCPVYASYMHLRENETLYCIYLFFKVLFIYF